MDELATDATTPSPNCHGDRKDARLVFSPSRRDSRRRPRRSRRKTSRTRVRARPRRTLLPTTQNPPRPRAQPSLRHPNGARGGSRRTRRRPVGPTPCAVRHSGQNGSSVPPRASALDANSGADGRVARATRSGRMWREKARSRSCRRRRAIVLLAAGKSCPWKWSRRASKHRRRSRSSTRIATRLRSSRNDATCRSARTCAT